MQVTAKSAVRNGSSALHMMAGGSLFNGDSCSGMLKQYKAEDVRNADTGIGNRCTASVHPECFFLWSRRRAPCSALLNRFPNASPRTVRASLNAYGSPSI